MDDEQLENFLADIEDVTKGFIVDMEHAEIMQGFFCKIIDMKRSNPFF